MNRILLSLATVSLFAIGCGRAAITTAPSSPEEARPESVAKTEATNAASSAPSDDAKADATPARKVGDFVVYRFSGSFRKAPLTLTERVLSRSGTEILVAITADDGKTKRELRVRFNDAPGARNEVLGVAKMDHGVEKAASIQAYEALMAETTVAADANEAVLGSEDVKVDLGKSTTVAKKTSYRVRLGKKHATLQTLESAEFAWGDVGGDITGENGAVIYQAKVVEVGHADAPAASNALAIDE
jgi:hypothetical protein